MPEYLSNIGRIVFDNCRFIGHRLLAPACVLCAGNADLDGLCAGCRADLPALPQPGCPTCAAPTPRGETCGRCLARPPAFDRVVGALAYGFPVDALVAGLKYRHGLAYARPLAARLAIALEREPYPDLVIPMPISPARLAERGFNQAAELARLVATEFGLRVDVAVARRRRDGVPQAALPWKERAHNVRGAFECGIDLRDKAIAVVDDVLTTGATLDELAKTLKRQGARTVTGWVAARTLRRH
jgi:ComF family protein